MRNPKKLCRWLILWRTPRNEPLLGQKGAEKPSNQYLVNGWSYEVGWPLILIRKATFLLVFHIMYTPQINRNRYNWHFSWKKQTKRLIKGGQNIKSTIHFIIVVTYQLILHIGEVWALQLHYFPQYCRFYVFDSP